METREIKWEAGGSLEGDDGGFGEVEGLTEVCETCCGVADAVEEEEDVWGWLV